MSESYDPKCEDLARYFMADGEIQPEEALRDLAQTIQDSIEYWFVGWNPLTGKHDLPEPASTEDIEVVTREILALRAATQRAPVTPPNEALERLDEQWKARCRVLMGDVGRLKAQLAAPAPVTTPGRDDERTKR